MYLHPFTRPSFLFPLLFLASDSKSQIDESDTTMFKLRIGAGGNLQQGNVEVFTIRCRVDFTYAPLKDYVIKSQNSSLYQSFSSKQVDNDIFTRNYLYYKPSAVVYPFRIVYVSSNYRRKIDCRVFAGAGLTWQLIRSSLHIVKLAGSGVYETTRFKADSYNYSKYNGSDQINLWRGTIYLGGWSYLLDKHIRLYYDAYWQGAFNDKNNYRIRWDIGMDMPVWKGIAFNAAYSFTHENVTVLNIKQEDKLLTFGLVYNLKK